MRASAPELGHPPPRSKRKQRKFRRVRKRWLIQWMRFAQKYRNSPWLIVGLFFLLVFHGFVPIVPVFLVLMAVVTLNGKRWVWFSLVSALGETTNNAITYFIGRVISSDYFFHLIHKLHWHKLWMTAEHEIEKHGPYAAFFGAVLGLPNPIITAIIGLADAEAILAGEPLEHSILGMFSLVLLGYLIRNGIICGATRFGWVQFEKKAISSESKRRS